MYLSKIDIVGFKSFANKIHIKFDTGMTAIVGPNGCGKTNVVDAIRWVLGEQKPTTLRSDKMEDVIFNGTKSRKPLGMAEVALTIENTKGVLPIEFNEVSIMRRVYRSGESEYYLNGTLCRLKDIRDLFMDTGMGSDAYSVIELKMVEIILSDNADERRHMFEEAAGVVKYKHRRKEALRRLNSVQQDLVRVNDIYREVEKAVNSLERQAKKAEQFNILTKELREFEIDFIEREFSNIHLTIGPLESEMLKAKNEKEKINTELNKGETELEDLKSNLGLLEEQLHESQEELAQLLEKINITKQERVSATERKTFLIGAIKKYENEIVNLKKQKVELEKNISSLIEKVILALEEYQIAQSHFDEKKKILDEAIVQLESKRLEVKSLQEKLIQFLNDITEIRNEHEKVKSRLENINGRIESAEEENNRFKIEIGHSEKEVGKLTIQDKELRRNYAVIEVKLNETESSKISLQKEIDVLRQEEFELKSLCERKKNRRDFLKGLVETHDGVSEGAKYLLTENQMQSTILNSVAEIISVSDEFRNAVELSLGEISGYLVVENISTAHRGIEMLRKSEKGKATFICLDRIPQIENVSLPKSATKAKFIKDIISFDKKFSSLVNYIFQNLILVDSLAEAISITNENPNFACVTIHGDLVSRGGIVKGGKDDGSSASIIGKKNQIDKLESEIKDLENEISSLLDKRKNVDQNIGEINLVALKEESKQVEQKMTVAEMRIAQIEYEKRRLEEGVERNINEVIKLKNELTILDKTLIEITPKISKLEEDKSLCEQNSGAARNELDRTEVNVSEMNKIVNAAHVDLVQKENSKNNLQREVEYVESTILNIEQTVAQRISEIDKSHEEIKLLEQKLFKTNSQIDLFSNEQKIKSDEKNIFDKSVSEKRKTVHSIELRIKDERRLHETSLTKAHGLEIKLSELRTRAESLKISAKEEFEIDLIVKEYSVEPIYNFEIARDEIHQKKEKLRALGAVNFTAFDEYNSEKERLDFMTAQRNDLIESETTLLETIAEINLTAQKRFMGTFSLIRENFVSIFKELFDEGDECDLILEEDVDPLEAHIEIIAKPRGKRPTSIDLLSGGEKTLTAIALLFAIYLVKPSPFCILDEVDAPLDDSNIDRFSRIIRKFSSNTQFIIVTHNKRTMESTNAMYGVTMEEEGVSKLVSVRFNEQTAAQLS